MTGLWTEYTHYISDETIEKDVIQMLTVGQLFNVIGIVLEAAAVYLIYKKMQRWEDKGTVQTETHLTSPIEISNEVLKEGQIVTILLILFGLLFQVTGTILS